MQGSRWSNRLLFVDRAECGLTPPPSACPLSRSSRDVIPIRGGGRGINWEWNQWIRVATSVKSSFAHRFCSQIIIQGWVFSRSFHMATSIKSSTLLSVASLTISNQLYPQYLAVLNIDFHSAPAEMQWIKFQYFHSDIKTFWPWWRYTCSWLWNDFLMVCQLLSIDIRKYLQYSIPTWSRR